MSDERFDPLSAQDFDALRALAQRIWYEHYTPIIGRGQVDYMLSRRFAPAALSVYLGSGERWMFVVRIADESVGYFSYARIEPHRIKLEQFYLLAQWRGAGAGTRMLEHVEEHGRKLGATQVSLQVNKRNQSALAFYRHRGFRVRDALRIDIGDGFVMDDYVMEKVLTP